MRKGGLFLAAGLVVVGGLGVRVFGTLQNGGAFSSTESQNVESCTRVRGVMGPEDVHVDHQSGLVFVSAHDRRADLALEGGGHVQGGIYVYDLANPSRGFHSLTARLDDVLPVFRPHGLSLVAGEDGSKVLMVISHRDDGDFVDIFDVEEEAVDGINHVALKYRKSVTNDLFASLNDVVALDAERFYVTNDHGSTNAMVKMTEDYFRLNIGTVVYFDGEKAGVAVKGQTYANGVNVSADQSMVYVAETTDRRISAYSVDKPSGALTLTQAWKMDHGVDNIDVASDGSLWIGGHPNMFDFIAHAEDWQVLSPGRVSRIDVTSGQVETILSTNGLEISGLSVAAPHAGKVIIGQVFNDGLLICE